MLIVMGGPCQFAQIKGQFLKKCAQSQAERKLTLDHVLNHLHLLSFPLGRVIQQVEQLPPEN